MRLPPRKLVAGLDLARRSDHSALVLLDVAPDGLTVSAALRLPQAPLRQQFAPQQLAARCALGDCQFTAPHGFAEPLDQPRLANDQPVSLRRAGER
ncbi:MAG: hypothetical protein ACJ8DM_10750, partial [Microvirga sp.]